MKLGVCLEMFFTDRPFAERIARAGDAGYRYAEMWFTDGTAHAKGFDATDAKDPARVAAVAAKAGVTLTNAVIGSPDGSTGGGLTNSRNRRQWLARARQTFAFCQDAGIGACIACTGNVIKGATAAAMRRSVVDGLKATAELAEAAGIDLWLEPLNDKINHPNYFCISSDAGAEICRAVHSPRMKLLFDCYHMQIMEGDLVGHIRKNLDVIGHVHSAGHPGRHELWLGETNYAFLVQQIEEMGYKGVFALEYAPTLKSADSLKKTRRCLSEFVKIA